MATNTPFIGLEKPAKGEYEDTWHIPLNDNFQLIDDNAVDAGTFSNRPDAGTAGRKYIATDEKVLYYDNGSSWNSIAGYDQNGNDLVDGGTTIWDATNGYVPASSIEDAFVQNTGDTMAGILDLGGNNLEDGTTTIWDATNGYVPASSIEDAFVLNTGDAISGDLDFGGANGILNLLRNDYEPATAAPTHVAGRTVLADGTNFDPDADGNAELVISNGSSWVEIVDLGVAL